MILTKIPCEFLGGPYDGHRPDLYPFVGSYVSSVGKYIRGDEKTKAGRIIFRWIFNQKGEAK